MLQDRTNFLDQSHGNQNCLLMTKIASCDKIADLQYSFNQYLEKIMFMFHTKILLQCHYSVKCTALGLRLELRMNDLVEDFTLFSSNRR